MEKPLIKREGKKESEEKRLERIRRRLKLLKDYEEANLDEDVQ